MERLSVVVITKNAGRTLDRCLESVRGLGELVVVDSGSTDDTVEIARRRGARLLHRTFDGYASQKNAGVAAAEGAWVLSLDADEWATPALREELPRVLDAPPAAAVAGFEVPMQTWYFGRELRHGGFSPDWHLRVFRRGRGEFRAVGQAVHEGVWVEGERRRLASPIGHEAYTSLSQYLEKFNAYTSLEAEGRAAGGRPVTGYDVAGRPVVHGFKRLALRAGWRDGVPGVLASCLASWYLMVVALKTLERRGFADPSLSLRRTLFKRK